MASLWSSSRHTPTTFCLAILFPLSTAALNTALSVTPSINWYGYDGDWSAVSLRLGSPQQWIDVFPNTQSSETWAVGPGGCSNNSLCASNRGGIFSPSTSSTWEPLGFFDLGVNDELGNTDYAYYGLDSLTFGSTGVTLSSSIIGSVNATDQWLGSFGLGTTPGSFAGKSPLSALSALVEQKGAIQSHTYGYTAGASYRQKGVPTSLTLGGYDANRLVPHPISFALNPSQQPQAYINSVSVVSATTANNWTSPLQLLSPSDRVSAIIDSSTPYLWFPEAVCDVFAQHLGLSYNRSLNLYTFDANPSQHDVLRASELTFTFSLSDLASSTNPINITLPYEAFDLQLTYPAIPNTTYGSAGSTKFYFPLRQATNAAQYRIGRAFLQEAYLITNYELNTFGVYQAVHPADPISNTSIVAIARDGSTTFSGPPATGKKLSAGAIAGVVIGAVVGVAILALALFWLCRRRKQDPENFSEKNDSSSQSSTSRFGRFFRRRRSPAVHEASGSENYPTEVGADAAHERFELPAPLGPAELDSESGTLGGRTDYSPTENSENLSAYEIARRKLERQQAGAGTQTQKTEIDVSETPHYRAPDSEYDSGPISPLGAGSENSMSMGQPSPMSPGFPSQGSSAPPNYRRIDPEHVVYVGRLPDNVRIPPNVPKVVGRDGRTIRSEPSDPAISTPTEAENQSLGSEYTNIETADLYGDSSGNQHSAVSPISNENGSSGGNTRTGAREPRDDAQLRDMLDPMGSRRRLDGDDFIHIPQPAANRFSFEEERISGNSL